MLILKASALQMRMDRGYEGALYPYNSNNPCYEVEPLRLQKLSFLNPPPLEGQELL